MIAPVYITVNVFVEFRMSVMGEKNCKKLFYFLREQRVSQTVCVNTEIAYFFKQFSVEYFPKQSNKIYKFISAGKNKNKFCIIYQFKEAIYCALSNRNRLSNFLSDRL